MSKIALISDIHFGEDSRSDEFKLPNSINKDETNGGASLLQGMVKILKEKKVEYLFIAGDLTSIGSPIEYYYCESKIINIARQLNIPNENIICCLGNHDIDQKIINIVDNDYKEISDNLKNILNQKYQLIASSTAEKCLSVLKRPQIEGVVPFSGLFEDKNFIVFILNSGWQCSQHQNISHGKLDDKQLNWFSKKLQEFERDSRKKIVLMHHHPIQYSYPTTGLDVSMIEESSQLIDIAGKYGIDMMLHGHRHHPTAKTIHEGNWKKPISFICAGSLSVHSQYRNDGEIPNTMHIIKFENGKDEIELFNYQYTLGPGWQPFTKSLTTPLDPYMKLGKLFTKETRKQAILKYKCYNGKLKWEELDECLKYTNYSTLNQEFRTNLSSTHEIFGEFPKKIMLLQKGEK